MKFSNFVSKQTCKSVFGVFRHSLITIYYGKFCIKIYINQMYSIYVTLDLYVA